MWRNSSLRHFLTHVYLIQAQLKKERAAQAAAEKKRAAQEKRRAALEGQRRAEAQVAMETSRGLPGKNN